MSVNNQTPRSHLYKKVLYIFWRERERKREREKERESVCVAWL